MRYLPHSEEEIRSMLDRIGVEDSEALFSPIPADVRAKPMQLEPALDEGSLMKHLTQLAAQNSGATMTSFLGGGMYDHHIPPAVDQLLLRSEFYTAYTPYQAEVSQGTLQSIFEFQTMVAELFGMEVANASMYCAASATAEAGLMAARITKRGTSKPGTIVLSEGLHPEYRETVKTYISGNEAVGMVEVPVGEDGKTDLRALQDTIDENTACVIVGYPNFYGVVEDVATITKMAHEKGALCVTSTAEPYALALIEAPGKIGVDIAVGEGQALAISPNFGGPGVGLFATNKKYVRNLPGRLVGETVDTDGKRGYVLTLSTREQHIRRERATSNICTNHGLVALSMTIRMAMLGRSGLEAASKLCLARSEYLKRQIAALEGFEIAFDSTTFNEFVVECKNEDADQAIARAAKANMLIGPSLGRFAPSEKNRFLIAVTEKTSKDEMDALVAALKS